MPSDNAEELLTSTVKTPLDPSAVVDPNSVDPLNSFTVLPASAVPTIVGVVLFVVVSGVVIVGLLGAVSSIVIDS